MASNEKNLTQQEAEINFIELWLLFLQKLPFLIVFALIGALIFGLYTFFFIPPKYTATSKLYMVSASQNAAINITDLQIGTAITHDYQELIMVRPMMESTIQNLDLKGTSVSGLRSMINIENPDNTRLLNITVTHTDPQLAADIANEVAELAISFLPNIMESTKPNIAENAIVPSSPAGPSYIRNSLMGGVVFALVYFVICIIQFLLNDTIHSSAEMEHYFSMTPLAAVPDDPSIFNESDTSHKQGKKTSKKAHQKENY